MRKNSFGEKVFAFLVVMGIFVFIGWISGAGDPKCIKSGCDHKPASGSSYCYLHKPYAGSRSSGSRSSYSSKSSGTSTAGSAGSSGSSHSNQSKTTTNSSYGSSTGKSNTSKKKSYESYDDGYDDVYMDDDYDDDRYNRDSDYADGVDDAMDELEEDW